MAAKRVDGRGPLVDDQPADAGPVVTGEIYEGAPRPSFGYRWTICALLFFAATINYVDRGVLGILGPTLTEELGWTEAQYGDIISWFSLAYGVGFLGMGRLMDRIGVRWGFSIAVVAWSLAAMAHAWARTATGFSVARAALGLGESGNFPGAIKATAEWFPKKERAFATGLLNAGTNVGAIAAPLLVPWIALNWGWQMAFIATGALGFLWLVFWIPMYRDPQLHPRVSPAELAHIRSDPAESSEHIPWLRLLTYRQTWAVMLGKFLTDPIWWFYLYWLPKFLDANFGVRLAGIAAPLIVIYLVADFGSVGGGWLSGALIKRGFSINWGRKIAMGSAALLIVPTMFAPAAGSLWVAVAIVSVAAASHQWWSANLYTIASDMFPRQAVASVIGLAGFAGAMGGVLFQRVTGRVLEATNNNYAIIFTVCGLAYVTAWLVIHLIVPRLQHVQLEDSNA